MIVLLPVALLPSLAWGLHGRLRPRSTTPRAGRPCGAEVDRATAARPGAVAVFPFTYYRRFAWNGDRVVLDPVPRLLDADVVANDDLPLPNGWSRGEDPRAARIRAGLDRGDDLAPCARRRGRPLGRGGSVDQPDIDGQRARLRDLPPLLWRGRRPGTAPGARRDRCRRPHRPPPVGHRRSAASPCWPRPAPSCCPGCAAAARLQPATTPGTDGGLAWRSAGTPASLLVPIVLSALVGLDRRRGGVIRDRVRGHRQAGGPGRPSR